MNRGELIQLLTKATEIRLNNLQDVQTLILAEEYEERKAEKKETKAADRMAKQRNVALKKKKQETKILHEVIQSIQDEPYYYSVAGRYIHNETDEEIAEKIHCDVTTVRRNRKKLLKKMAFSLYDIQEDEYAYEKM